MGSNSCSMTVTKRDRVVDAEYIKFTIRACLSAYEDKH